jgi:hypothetical protein
MFIIIFDLKMNSWYFHEFRKNVREYRNFSLRGSLVFYNDPLTKNRFIFNSRDKFCSFLNYIIIFYRMNEGKNTQYYLLIVKICTNNQIQNCYVRKICTLRMYYYPHSIDIQNGKLEITVPDYSTREINTNIWTSLRNDLIFPSIIITIEIIKLINSFYTLNIIRNNFQDIIIL